jgi:hypothetical protein
VEHDDANLILYRTMQHSRSQLIANRIDHLFNWMTDCPTIIRYGSAMNNMVHPHELNQIIVLTGLPQNGPWCTNDYLNNELYAYS